MCRPALFAYRSALQGSIPMAIPDVRDPAVRGKNRHDTACVDPKVAGDQLLPPSTQGTPQIPEAVYEEQKKLWEAIQAEKK